MSNQIPDFMHRGIAPVKSQCVEVKVDLAHTYGQFREKVPTSHPNPFLEAMADVLKDFPPGETLPWIQYLRQLNQATNRHPDRKKRGVKVYFRRDGVSYVFIRGAHGYKTETSDV